MSLAYTTLICTLEFIHTIGQLDDNNFQICNEIIQNFLGKDLYEELNTKTKRCAEFFKKEINSKTEWLQQKEFFNAYFEAMTEEEEEINEEEIGEDEHNRRFIEKKEDSARGR